MNDKKVCELFLKNKTVNPKTGRPIQPGKKTYNDLMLLCQNLAVPIVQQKKVPVAIPLAVPIVQPKKVPVAIPLAVPIVQPKKVAIPSAVPKQAKQKPKPKQKAIVPVAVPVVFPAQPAIQQATQPSSIPKQNRKELEANYDLCAKNYGVLPAEYKKSLKDYQDTWYSSVNDYLWAHQGILKQSDFDMTDGYDVQWYTNIKNLFDSIKKNGLTATSDFFAYRNFIFNINPSSMAYLQKMKTTAIGGVLPVYSFLSLSALPDTDVMKKNPQGAATILIPKGTRYICPSKRTDEMELILPPGKLEKISSNSGAGVWKFVPL